jgi:hypothetical protein
MTTRMPGPRLVAYTVATGRALIDCGEHVVWMTGDDALGLSFLWREMADDIDRRNMIVDEARL